ncbi:MAG: hypothetical protein OXR68_01655, partial [Alphaproteobacteria bacterium]|nr:hypothetical protein [Alphaproteobacteria bacterium]
CIGAVHADDGADVPNKRYKMWDSRYVPTSNFQLCRELEGILNHPINIERTTWLPDRLFKIPDENRNFRHIKWTKVPKREWGNYYEDKYPDRRTSLYAPLPKGEEQVLEKAYYDADHFEGPQWMVRYKFAPTPFKPWAKPIAHAGGPAKFENNSFGSPFFPPFWYKGRVFNFSGGIREFGGEVSVWEPKVYTNLGTLPKYDDDQVCIFNDNFYAEGK